ncbi:MAG: DUF192 domain-containing protein [Acidimicrobiia bacterium]
MRGVMLSTGDWHVRAYLAETFADRLLGNRRAPAGAGVMIRTRSVHTFGQRSPIEVVGLDGLMRVVATRTLAPNRIGVLRSARVIVELPAGSPLPAIHDRVEMSDG